uniref:Kin1 protein n=1 Tax=Brassica campestris TaxID=3711 RepID=Q42495_BRACM|nr:kin1 [Brassica rapa]CAA80862.1 kin1 [Brassica rapa]
MADNKQSFQAGQAAGRAEEKGNVLMDKVKDAATAGASAETAGQKITEAAGGAVNLVKEKTGMNK